MMNNIDIMNHVFNDAELDTMKDFNYVLRGALIEGKVSKSQYLKAEMILADYIRQKDLLEPNTQQYLDQILGDV